MRLCFVSRELAPFGGGGIGTYVALMTRALAEAGHQVHVLTQPYPDLPPTTPEGVRIHRVCLDKGLAARDAYPHFPQRYAMAVHEALQQLHAAHPFDAIEFPEFYGEGWFALRAHRRLGAYPGAGLAVRLHTPSVLVRELNGVHGLGGEAAALDVMERDSLRDADRVLSPTRSLLELASERFGPFERSAVVPHPFDVAWTAELGTARQALSGRARILYFGRLERRKGVHLLLPALAGLLRRGIDAELVLLGGDTPTGPGETSMRAALEAQVGDALQGRVHFEEARGRAALGDAITTAQVCCFPSLWENFPNVCLEAMAVGCPVVASDAGGMAEILEHGRSGLLFPTGDAAALEDRLAKVLTDQALASSLAANAHARLASYCHPARIAEALEAELRQEGRAAFSPGRPPRGRSPAISVIVPFFNLARTFPQTLSSLDAQTFRDFEVIVCDDGSTEIESRELLDRLSQEEKIRLVRQPNAGVSSARNAALHLARGEYVLPLDPDDALAPAFLERTLEVLGADPNLGWCTSLVEFFSDSSGEDIGGWTPLGHAPELMAVENVAASCTALFRRELLEGIGGYDESLPAFEDWDVYCSLLERGHRGEVLPEFLFRYRIRERSLAHGMSTELRYALRAQLIAKHPALLGSTAMRRLLSEAEEVRRELAQPRYALIDRVNAAIKRVPGIHRVLKRALKG